MLAGQSAIEYLMTYGWMLLVVAVVGGAVFSMVGEQSIESIQGFNDNRIHAADFGLTDSSLQINVGASGADNVVLKEVKLSDSSNNVSIPLNHEISAGQNSVLNLPHLTQSNEVNNVKIDLVYDTGSLQNITSSGTVTGELEIDESLMGYWTMNEMQSNSTHILDISQGDNHAEIGGANFVNDGTALEFDGDEDYIGIPDDSRIHQALEGEESTFIVRFDDGEYGDSWGTWMGWTAETDEGEQAARFAGQGLTSNLYMRWYVEPAETSYTHTDAVWARNTPDKAGEPMFHASSFQTTNSGYTVRTWIDDDLESQQTGDQRAVLGEASNIGDFQPAQYAVVEDILIFDRALSTTEVRSLYNTPHLID